MSSVKALLLTQCLQNDFIRLLDEGEPLPNLVHVGALESDRLSGKNGALSGFLKRTHATPAEELGIVHIVDRHDPARHGAHLERFRPHCISGTPGADLVAPLPELVACRRGTPLVEGGDLSDAEDSDLGSVLRALSGGDLSSLRVGVIGVWTNVKVMFLLYDLATRLGARHLATCSALTASRSMRGHFAALDEIRDVLGVTVFHSPGEFLDWLGVSTSGTGVTEDEERQALVSALSSEGTSLSPLGGGFSGSQVFLARDGDGAASVLKVGRRGEIACERFGNERIRRILGDGVPALLGYREGGTLAAMRMELADSHDPSAARPATFKKLFESDPSEDATAVLEGALQSALGSLLGRFYHTAEKDNADLLEAYGFTDAHGRPRWADSVVAKAEAIATTSGFSGSEAFLEGQPFSGPFMSPREFYQGWLPGQSRREEVYSSVVHADLNLANILVSRRRQDGGLFRTWVIDFARLARFPNLTDFAKVENDLTYILLRLEDEKAASRAFAIQEARLSSTTLMPQRLESLAETPLEKRYIRLLLALRRLAAEVDPRGAKAMATYRVALLRYAAHTLGFDEPSLPQLRLALAGVARLAALVAEETPAART
ncbi:MAG: hypothetical protein DIJKHBIC_03941 [Thermoanaerobaculia bacterium]|nr:hypothetical protein [Thermoanaerobaculia bacterium]